MYVSMFLIYKNKELDYTNSFKFLFIIELNLSLILKNSIDSYIGLLISIINFYLTCCSVNQS